MYRKVIEARNEARSKARADKEDNYYDGENAAYSLVVVWIKKIGNEIRIKQSEERHEQAIRCYIDELCNAEKSD